MSSCQYQKAIIIIDNQIRQVFLRCNLVTKRRRNLPVQIILKKSCYTLFPFMVRQFIYPFVRGHCHYKIIVCNKRIRQIKQPSSYLKQDSWCIQHNQLLLLRTVIALYNSHSLTFVYQRDTYQNRGFVCTKKN